MKSFILATLMVAASATAAEQGVAPTPVEPVERAPADAMWTNEQIKNWVSVNHGGFEWGAFEQNQLLTEESRQAFVGTMITNMVEEWQTSQNYLPNVCEPGIACRAEVNKKLVMDLEDLWKQMLVTIDSKITNKKASVDIRLVEFYEEAYDCVPGCECENIYIEYDQLIKWQTDLSTRIVEYTSNLHGLITNEQQIIASCPAYIYDSDGNAFFDYSGNGASLQCEEMQLKTIGCFNDRPQRGLPQLLIQQIGFDIPTEEKQAKCAQAAADAGLSFFGLQYPQGGSECWGGNDYDLAVSHGESSCGLEGDNWMNQIYQIANLGAFQECKHD